MCVCVHCRCECTPGYVGEHCELDYNDCEENKCQNGGQCIDAINGYTCVCPEGYRSDSHPNRISHILIISKCCSSGVYLLAAQTLHVALLFKMF